MSKKQFVKKIEGILPKSIYLLLRSTYIFINKLAKKILFMLNYLILFIPNLILRSKKKFLLISNNKDLGGTLVWTSIIRDFPKEYDVLLYYQNENIFKNIPIKKKRFKKGLLNNLYLAFLASSYHSNIIGECTKKHPNARKIHSIERTIYERRLSEHVNRNHNKPWILFDKKELSNFKRKYKALLSVKKGYGLVISENNYSGWSRVKNWGCGKMEKVVNNTASLINWVQVGIKEDTRLEGITKDLRGKTSIRELLFLASSARLILTTEGLLTHVSAAFNAPCVTILPGFIDKEHSNYPNVKTVLPDQSIPCLGCWSPHCPYKKVKCLESISPELVTKEAKKVLKKNKHKITK